MKIKVIGASSFERENEGIIVKSHIYNPPPAQAPEGKVWNGVLGEFIDEDTRYPFEVDEEDTIFGLNRFEKVVEDAEEPVDELARVAKEFVAMMEGKEDLSNRESAIKVAIEYLEKEGEEVQRNQFSKGWAIKEGYGKDGNQIQQKSSEKSVKDELYEALVADEALPDGQTLEEHDRRHHPKGYHEGDTCKFRDRLATETETDKGDELNVNRGEGRKGSEVENSTNLENPLVTPEEDRAYLEAVDRGDMETAAKMVREAAARYMQGASVFVMTNGEPDYFQVSKKPIVPYYIQGAKTDKPRGDREYFTDAFLNLKNVLDLMDGYQDDKRIGGENFDEREYGREMANRFCDLIEKAGYQIDRENVVDELVNGDWENSDPFHRLFSVDRQRKVEALKKLGYDGVVWDIDDNDVYAFDKGSIINASSVAKDDKGRVIPLSQRFGGETETDGEGGKEETKDTEKVYEGLSKKQVKKYKELMEKKHPELDADLVLTELGKIKDRKVQECAFGWAMKGAIKLPEDNYKVEEAIKRGEEAFNAFTGAKKTMEAADTTIAKAKEALESAAGDSNKEDRARQRLENAEKRIKAAKDTLEKYGDVSFNPMDYDTPMGMIEAMHGFKRTEKPITVEELKKNPLMSDYRDEGYGVETFQVDDSREGQALMRQVLNTHWGKDANPWCLLHGDGEGNLSDGSDGGYDAWEYWNHYNSLPKRVAFKDGKLLAFMGTDGSEFSPEADSLREEYEESDDYRKYDMPFDNWLMNNYPDVNPIGEQWWDRQDKPHKGIPLGETEVPNDKLGRKVDMAELINGEMTIPKGMKKYIGREGEKGYKAWDDDGRFYEDVGFGKTIREDEIPKREIKRLLGNRWLATLHRGGNFSNGRINAMLDDKLDLVGLMDGDGRIITEGTDDYSKYVDEVADLVSSYRGEDNKKDKTNDIIVLPNGTKIKKVLAYLYTDSKGQLHDEKWSVAREKKLGDGRISKEFSDVLDTLLSGKDVSDEAIMALPEWAEAMELEKEIEGRLQKDYGVARTSDINTRARNRFRNAIVEAALSDHITKTVPIEGYDGEVFETNEGLEEGESYDVEKGKKVFIAIGLPAAGKSTTFANPLAKKYKARLCDSDTVKKVLPEFANGYGGNLVHEESTDINERILAGAVENGDNIVYPILGYKPEKLQSLMKMFKDKGYEVNLCFKDMPANIAKGRLLGRFLQKGRYLPLTCISKAQGKVGDAFEAVKDMADAYIRSSSEPDGSGERIIDSKGSIL